jgi:hypothetical protein
MSGPAGHKAPPAAGSVAGPDGGAVEAAHQAVLRLFLQPAAAPSFAPLSPVEGADQAAAWQARPARRVVRASGAA